MDLIIRNDMEMKFKMYLSFPITGRNIKDVKVYAKRIKKTWEDKGYEVVNPFEVTEHFNGVKEGHSYYAYCMGKCVEALLTCDGIIMCDDWFMSKGCRTENYVAQVYGKMIRVDNQKYLGRKENGTDNQV